MTIRMTKTMDTFCQRNAQRGHDYYGDDVNDYDEEERDNDDDEDKDDDNDNDNDDDKRYFSTAARLSQLFIWKKKNKHFTSSQLATTASGKTCHSKS